MKGLERRWGSRARRRASEPARLPAAAAPRVYIYIGRCVEECIGKERERTKRSESPVDAYM